MNYPHFFCDQDHCLKCGQRWAWPEIDNCFMSDDELRVLERAHGPGVRADKANLRKLVEQLRA